LTQTKFPDSSYIALIFTGRRVAPAAAEKSTARRNHHVQIQAKFSFLPGRPARQHSNQLPALLWKAKLPRLQIPSGLFKRSALALCPATTHRPLRGRNEGIAHEGWISTATLTLEVSQEFSPIQEAGGPTTSMVTCKQVKASITTRVSGQRSWAEVPAHGAQTL